MKRISIIVIMLSILLLHFDVFAQSKSITINNIELPSVNSIKMKNGLRVFYIKDELPRIVIILSAGFGKIYENNNNAGISDLVAKSLVMGGSRKYPGDMLHNTIENIGGKFNIESSWEETSITVEVLERYSDIAFDIIRDLIENPDMDNAVIENARSLLLEEVRRKTDSPETIGFEKAREIIFNGRGYGAFTTEKSIKSISRDNILAVMKNYFTSGNIQIGISTSLSFNEIKKKMSKFDSVKKGPVMDYAVDPASIPLSIIEKSKNIYLLPKDIPQATIIIGTIAPEIKNSRIYSLSIMNDILGGSDFNSRLMHEIRVKRGLAYSVQSVIKFRKKTGVFLAYAQTKNESADTVLSLMLDNLKDISQSHVKPEELKLSKDSIRNSYIFEFDNSANLLMKYLFLSYNSLDEPFLLQYVNQMDSVSAVDIEKNARELFANGVIKVVIGKKELESNLEKFGKVIIIKE